MGPWNTSQFRIASLCGECNHVQSPGRRNSNARKTTEGGWRAVGGGGGRDVDRPADHAVLSRGAVAPVLVFADGPWSRSDAARSN
jgi:hypothetical protein